MTTRVSRERTTPAEGTENAEAGTWLSSEFPAGQVLCHHRCVPTQSCAFSECGRLPRLGRCCPCQARPPGLRLHGFCTVGLGDT